MRGWSAMTEELVLAWVNDPAGVTRDELLAIIAPRSRRLVASAG